MKLSDGCKYVINKLENHGFKAYAVGGCVRNRLLGLEPKDYDVTTNAMPDDMLKIFSYDKTLTNGIKHGTVTVLVNGEAVETTTFRSDGEYSDFRRPESVKLGVTLQEDLERRDFTVNAMAYCDERGIVDFFGGKEDVKNKIIRCVGEPDKRFNEDALRIMRALRFASTYGFSIEKNTSDSIHRNKELLRNIAVERIFSEFSLLLCGEDVENILFDYSDVLAVIIPQIKTCLSLFLTGSNHEQTLWEHTVRAVAAVPPKLEYRLAMLLHDIAKPDYKNDDDDGLHFENHAKKSAEKAETILKHLKAPTKLINAVTLFIRYHDYQCEACEPMIKRFMRLIGSENALSIFTVIRRADIMAQNGDNSGRLKKLNECSEICKNIIENKDCVYISDLVVNGGDIIALGIKRGELVGEILNKLLNAVYDSKVSNSKPELLQYVKSNIIKG